ncbi:TRAP transporter small permease subunit [Poseidonocella sp. HB161398]|uniref:TRAP transporter small permease subunit n=1 Tax=Poseidonocella sp. HB161398 TaxID=2320855 RepID=UPI001109BAF3|nr:TRAP transporter small permease [Poseidonocella sp. HB161398]
MWDAVHGALRRANRLVALLLGAALMAVTVFILFEVAARKLGTGTIGGSEEISAYVMAALSSWGLACALAERAHVRIDYIRQKLAEPGRVLMDLFAMVVTNATVILIAVKCWPVLEKTLKRGSTANTVLETPMWIPQGIWFAGWIWFAATATLVTLAGIAFFLDGRRDALDRAIGMGSELDQ